MASSLSEVLRILLASGVQSQLPGEALKLSHMVLGGFAGVAHHAKFAGPDLAHLSHAHWAGGGSRYRAPRQLEAASSQSAVSVVLA